MTRLPIVLAVLTAATLMVAPAAAFANDAATSCITTHDDLPYRIRVTMCRCLEAKANSLRGWVEWIFVARSIRQAGDLNVCTSAALSGSATLPPVQERRDDIEISRATGDVTGSLRLSPSWLIPRPRDPLRRLPADIASP